MNYTIIEYINKYIHQNNMSRLKITPHKIKSIIANKKFYERLVPITFQNEKVPAEKVKILQKQHKFTENYNFKHTMKEIFNGSMNMFPNKEKRV